VPHFKLVVGRWTNNAGSYGLAIDAVPSKRVREIVQMKTSNPDDEPGSVLVLPAQCLTLRGDIVMFAPMIRGAARNHPAQ
jgi:hypothetical protein